MKKIFSCICLLICLWDTNALAKTKCDTYIMGKCFSCHSPMTFEISSDEICQTICPERIVIHTWKSSFCALSKCPKSHPYRDEKTGDCRLSQQTPMDIELNKINIAEHANKEKYSIPAKNNKCPENKPLLSKGFCYPCDYKYPLSINKELLKYCPNRINIPYPWIKDHNEILTYLICPKDRPLYHWSGECYPCNYPDTIPVLTQCIEDKKICDVCPNRTILPLSGGNRPSVLNCPKDKPLMDINGICFSCDTPLKINITGMEDSCHKNCSNQRVLQGNLCVKK